ncbi:MAG TPA: hypothetical protein DCX46_04835 [Bacteroidetes bacterium]|nr:MAG: hypothetical protein A2X68_12860 [Ignavibacteria bacterium GWC2_56_12]HAV22814.1 hypothetical protein [Bacteroidota bacterium]
MKTLHSVSLAFSLHNRRVRGILCSVLTTVVLTGAYAQVGDRTKVRAVGMARTVNANTLGVDAFGVNPANLGLPSNRTIDIGIANVGFHVKSELINYEIYQKYFTGVPGANGERVAMELTDQDKEDLMAMMADDGETRFDGELNLFSLALCHPVVGGLGVSINEHVGVRNFLTKNYFRMALFLLPQEGALYDLSGTSFEGWWWRDYNFSYGRKLPFTIPFFKETYFGFSVKFIRGYGYFGTDYYRSKFGTELGPNGLPTIKGSSEFLVRRTGADFLPDLADGEFSNPFPDPAGKGRGLDFGLAAELNNGIHLSAGVVNIGSITWEENVRETEGAGEISISNPLDMAGRDSLEQAFSGIDRVGAPFTTNLPTQLRFGASMWSDEVAFLQWLPGRMMLAFDYTQGLNSSLGNSTTPRLSVGTEYRLIPLLPLRTGIAVGGGDKFRWAAGLGLDLYVLTLDFGTENIGVLFSPDSFSMFEFSFAMRIKV